MAVPNEAPCSRLGYGVWSTPYLQFFVVFIQCVQNRIRFSSFFEQNSSQQFHFFTFFFCAEKGDLQIPWWETNVFIVRLDSYTPPRPRPTQSKLELLTTPRLGPPSINSRASHTHFLEGSNLRDMDMETSTEEVKGTTLIEFTSSRVVHESPWTSLNSLMSESIPAPK